MLGGWKIGVVCNWESIDVNLIHGRINETHSLFSSTACKLYVSRTRLAVALVFLTLILLSDDKI